MLPDRILFAFALARESRRFRVLQSHARIAITGVGPACATQSLAQEIDRDRPDAVVIAGYSGSLVDQLKIGDIVVSNRVMNVNSGTAFNPQTQWCESHFHSGGIHGTLCSSDRIIGEPGDKRALAEKYHAVAVDMESAAVALVCDQAGIPWVAIRVISDNVDQTLSPELVDVLSAGSVSVGRALHAAIRHPKLFPEFVRLARDTRLASDRLAAFLAANISSSLSSVIGASR